MNEFLKILINLFCLLSLQVCNWISGSVGASRENVEKGPGILKVDLGYLRWLLGVHRWKPDVFLYGNLELLIFKSLERDLDSDQEMRSRNLRI